MLPRWHRNDHQRPPYTIYVDAESETYDSLRAPAGHRQAQRNDGPRDDEVRKQPRTAVQQPEARLQGRRAGADRQPAYCGAATTEPSLAPYTGNPRHCRRSCERSSWTATAKAAPAPRRCHSRSPRARPHSPPLAELPRASRSTWRVPTASSTCPCEHRSAARPGRQDPVRAACPEPQAYAGSCPLKARSARSPRRSAQAARRVSSHGPVYLTGPTERRPYGMTDGVNAATGPVQPRQRRRAQQDRSQPAHAPGHGRERNPDDLQGHPVAHEIAEAGDQRARASWSTRPTARAHVHGHDPDIERRGDPVRLDALPGRAAAAPWRSLRNSGPPRTRKPRVPTVRRL